MAQFICVGVGPGNQEHLTLAVKEAIEKAEVLTIPVTRAGEKGFVYTSILPWIQDQEIVELHFPMEPELAARIQRREAAAEVVMRLLDQGKTCVMPAIGDPAFYSTCFHVLERVKRAGYETKVLPGVTSFSAASALVQAPLAMGDERFALLSSVEDEAEFKDLLTRFDQLCILKVWKNLEFLKDILRQEERLEHSWFLQRIGFLDEKIMPLADVDTKKTVPYFSLVLILKEDAS